MEGADQEDKEEEQRRQRFGGDGIQVGKEIREGKREVTIGKAVQRGGTNSIDSQIRTYSNLTKAHKRVKVTQYKTCMTCSIVIKMRSY